MVCAAPATLWLRRMLSSSCLAFFALCTITSAAAQTETVIHTFGGPADGFNPIGGLVADSHGALYGVTWAGGEGCTFAQQVCGVVYKLTPPATADASWTESILYTFTGGDDGAGPSGGLLYDEKTGKLYGGTIFGGTHEYGVAFELAPGNPWTENVLHRFNGIDGLHPHLSTFYKGRLAGVTEAGGLFRSGTIFTLLPPSQSGGDWMPKPLHFFDGSEGSFPEQMVADAAGNLFGATRQSGPDDFGTIFQLAPASNGIGPATLTVLYAFTGKADGVNPGNLLLGSDGALYGSTLGGGSPPCLCGTIFRLSPPSGGSGPWTFTTIRAFTGAGAGGTPSNLVFDRSGKLYGVGETGGIKCNQIYQAGCGVVFSLTPPTLPGGSWTEKVVYAFRGGEDGVMPTGSLLVRNNKIYGTTYYGGNDAQSGTVFEITP